MLHRIGISLKDEDMKRLKWIQKHFKAQTRSEAIHRLLDWYRKNKLEEALMNQVIDGYRRIPETPIEVKDRPAEDW